MSFSKTRTIDKGFSLGVNIFINNTPTQCAPLHVPFYFPSTSFFRASKRVSFVVVYDLTKCFSNRAMQNILGSGVLCARHDALACEYEVC